MKNDLYAGVDGKVYGRLRGRPIRAHNPGSMNGTGDPALHILLDSFVAVASERSETTVLEQAVDLARLVTSARYGAAATVADGRLSLFVHHGLTTAQVEILPHEPVGLGMLGAALHGVVRTERMQDDPRSVGFPLHHVPMQAFLGVPILLESEVIGALYLTKAPGQGAFTEENELFVQALARQAGIALGAVRVLAEKDRVNEELRAADRIKGDFLAMASHELRTPLSAIRAAASTLRRHQQRLSEERAAEMIDTIDRQSIRLAELIDNLLTAATIDAGTPAVHVRPVPVAAVARDVADELTSDLPEGCTVDCPDDVVAAADAGHLRQMLVNLLGNALKYGAPPYVITGRLHPGGVEVRVTDGGPGVPPDFVAELFGLFTRARPADGPAGTGIGLAIVDGLARAGGGKIRYEPNIPHGACFVLTLPRA
jgi:signal transduction histidine kinase